jgi:hypothetical protein
MFHHLHETQDIEACKLHSLDTTTICCLFDSLHTFDSFQCKHTTPKSEPKTLLELEHLLKILLQDYECKIMIL